MKKFLHDNQGATAIEYAFLCALIALVMLAGLIVLGKKNSDSYNNTAAQVSKHL